MMSTPQHPLVAPPVSDERPPEDRADEELAHEARADEERTHEELAHEDRADEARADEERTHEELAHEDRADEARADEELAHQELAHEERAAEERTRDEQTARDQVSPEHGADDRPGDLDQVVHSGTQDRTIDVDTAEAEEPAGMRPGEEPPAPVPHLWNGNSARDLRDRMREAQVRFLDDPRAAVEEVEALVDEAVEAFTAKLGEQRQDLTSWRTTGADDTEQLRVVVQRYRDFLERVLSL